jgi:hypothetical protein
MNENILIDLGKVSDDTFGCMGGFFESVIYPELRPYNECPW